MVDSVLLLVDASEGPLPQTRSCFARRWPRTCRSSWWSTRPTGPTPGSPSRRGQPDLLLDVASDLDDGPPPAEHALGLRRCMPPARRGGQHALPADGEIPTATTLIRCSTCCSSTSAAVGRPRGAAAGAGDQPRRVGVLGRLALIRIYNGRLRKGQTVAWSAGRRRAGHHVGQDHRTAGHRRRRAQPDRRSDRR